MAQVRVRVPATTANLGPGFDCLGLTLDLWNETLFSLEGDGLRIELEGEGKGRLPLDRSNVMAYAFRHFCRTHGVPEPAGLRIHSCSAIPTSSGLGSSASAALLGLLAASALLQIPASPEELLALAAGMEGHADNAAAALHGGLVVILAQGDGWLVRRFDVPPIRWCSSCRKSTSPRGYPAGAPQPGLPGRRGVQPGSDAAGGGGAAHRRPGPAEPGDG